MKDRNCRITLTFTEAQHRELYRNLFPGDGKESVAIALCNRRAGTSKHRLLVKEIHPVPYDQYIFRDSEQVNWKTDFLEQILETAANERLSVVKIHSHPNEFTSFSALDNNSDSELLPMIYGWLELDIPHASVVMLPDGSMFGRSYWGMEMKPFDLISVIGSDLYFWPQQKATTSDLEFADSHSQAFGSGTTNLLQQLSVAVIGCSGTGSLVTEQLARLGVGHLILVDYDLVEERNLNRIINARRDDAQNSCPKVDILARAVKQMDLGTKVHTYQSDLWNREVILAVAECDIVFGCMDTTSGRFLLNTLATYYLLPYFDVGVKLESHSNLQDGQIHEICGTVHYLQPGKSSLISRGLISMAMVEAERLAQTDPDMYEQQKRDGYIRGVDRNHSTAVISVNMQAASLVLNDFLARIHPYREEDNKGIESITFSLSSLEFFMEAESPPCSQINQTGIGDQEPLLGMLDFAVR